MKKEDVEKLGVIELIVLCNEKGLPEGSKEDMQKSLTGPKPKEPKGPEV